MALHRQNDHWERDALCRYADPELFFPVGAEGFALSQRERAQAICSTCPVGEQCLAFALDARIDHGIWGGTTPKQRRFLHRADGSRTFGDGRRDMSGDAMFRAWLTAELTGSAADADRRTRPAGSLVERRAGGSSPHGSRDGR